MVISESLKVPILAVANDGEKLFAWDARSGVNGFRGNTIAPPHFLAVVVEVRSAIWRLDGGLGDPNERYFRPVCAPTAMGLMEPRI
jgi:hypothetical protein